MVKSKRGRRPRGPVGPFGDTGDGGLVILGEDETVLHVAPRAVTAAIRYFLARLETQNGPALPRRLAVTSALRGEGVTFLSRSLAAVLAFDQTAQVALVDLNWWSPTPLGKGAPDRPGIADVIEQGVAIDDVLMPTSNPRLTLVPPGNVAISRRPVLARSPELADVLDKLGARFDHLILDVPAVRATSDALTLCQLADAFILVVHQGVTPEHHVERALEDLSRLSVLGVLLNRTNSYIPKRLRRLLN